MGKKLGFALLLAALLALFVSGAALAADCEHEWTEILGNGRQHSCPLCGTTASHSYTNRYDSNSYGYIHTCADCGYFSSCSGASGVTCTASGICNGCGFSYTNNRIHSYVQIAEQPATCAQPGLNAHYQCEWCSRRFTRESFLAHTTLEALTVTIPHSFTKELPSNVFSHAVSCTAYYYAQCDNCSYVDQQRTVAVVVGDHDWEASAGTAHYHVCTYCRLSEEHEYTSNWYNSAYARYNHACAKCGNTSGCNNASAPDVTCSVYATCTTCNQPFNDPKDHNSKAMPRINPTCTQPGRKSYYHCQWCNVSFKDYYHTTLATDENLYIAPLDHAYTLLKPSAIPVSEASCLYPAEYYAECDRCDHVSGEIIVQSGDPLGHDYKATLVKPSCGSKGCTEYVCARCSDSYRADQTPALAHWYGLWFGSGDGTHTAACRRDGCDQTRTVGCSAYTALLGEAQISVCPICGEMGDQTLPAISAAGTPPTRGEWIVRGLENPFEGALYALTVAYEYAGAVDEFIGTVQVEIPLPETLTAFRLVQADGTELAFSRESGLLTFEPDAAGLFLLLPIQ